MKATVRTTNDGRNNGMNDVHQSQYGQSNSDIEKVVGHQQKPPYNGIYDQGQVGDKSIR
jgi:hypothetical protein